MWKPCAEPPGEFILILVWEIRMTSCFVYRWTPLQTAAATGKAEVVRQLVEAGARVNARTTVKIGWGKTAGDLAKEHGHHEVVRLLLGDKAAGKEPPERPPADAGVTSNANAPSPGPGGPQTTSGGGAYPDGGRQYAQYAQAPHTNAAEAYPAGKSRLSRFISSKAFVAFLVLCALLLVGGLSALRGMQNELTEWRAIREKKAARREKAEKAAAFKRAQEVSLFLFPYGKLE